MSQTRKLLRAIHSRPIWKPFDGVLGLLEVKSTYSDQQLEEEFRKHCLRLITDMARVAIIGDLDVPNVPRLNSDHGRPQR